MYPFENEQLSLDERVKDLIFRLTAEEKITLLPSHHPAIERLGLAEFALGGEGAHGLVMRDGGIATVFPQPIGLSMTWDKGLMREIGSCIGDEARIYYRTSGRASHLVLFFPTIDMERDPRWGRNEEAYGEDPFLAGKLAAELIQGLQGDGYWLKAVAMPKHFYANNYEFERTTADSVIGQRLKYEYYLRVFAYAFEEGGAKSLMAAYNKINGAVGMINPELNTVVRDKWGCDGFFVSDGGAFGLAVTEHKFGTYAETAAAAIKSGLDVFLDKPNLVINAVAEALKQGLLTENDVDRALFNQLRILFRLGVYGGGNPYDSISDSALCSSESSKLAGKAARESVVLLKNDGVLPLPQTTKRIAVIGSLGGENLPDWYSGNPPYTVTIADGIKAAFPESEVVFSDGCDLVGFYSEKEGAWARVTSDGAIKFDGVEANRTLFHTTDWGYGGFAFCNTRTSKFLTTTLAGELRCDGEAFWGWFVRELFFVENGEINDGTFVEERPHGSMSGIGVAMKKGISVYDKPYEEGGAEKVNAVLGKIRIKVIKDGLAEAVEAAKHADVAITVIGNHPLVGARECIDRADLEVPKRWGSLIENARNVNPNTVLTVVAGYPYALRKQEDMSRAVLFTSHGAQELGTAIGETLSGKNNPSGKLTQTWYETSGELPDINDYDIIRNKMTYLYCDRPVLHPFGFGLSYTSFTYSDLITDCADGSVKLSFSVTNTGHSDGATVAQVYYSRASADKYSPLKRLAGFERVYLKRGEASRIDIIIPYRELSRYDTETDDFVFESGMFSFFAGESSTDLPLSATVMLTKVSLPKLGIS